MGERIPEKGWSEEEIWEKLNEYSQEDVQFEKVFSLVYHKDEAHTKFLEKVVCRYLSTNALNPLAFKSLLRFEKEVVQMAAHLFHGDAQVVGHITSGGTESLILAIKAYRDYGRFRKGIRRPNIVLPITAHVGFQKACEYLQVTPLYTPIDKNFQADVEQIKNKVNRNTVAICLSAPSYPFGIVDPIEEVARFAKERGVPLHVDACLGGFFLPFVEQLGYSVPLFDFRLEGVTSLSADLHKYGYAAKGASLILYRSMDYLQYQFSIFENWPGGIYVSPTILGTRPGGPIAAAWATLKRIGMQGYLENAKKVMEITQRLIQGIREIEELEIFGKPHMSVFGYYSKDPKVNIFAVADVLEEKGWHVDRQHRPEGIHHIVNPNHQGIVEEYLADLKDAVCFVKKHPEKAHEGRAAIYGLSAKIPLRGLVRKQILKTYQQLYGAEGDFEIDHTKEDFSLKVGKWYLKLWNKLFGR